MKYCGEANVIKPFSTMKHTRSTAEMSRQRPKTITETETVPVNVSQSGPFGQEVHSHRGGFSVMLSRLFVCYFVAEENSDDSSRSAFMVGSKLGLNRLSRVY